MYKKLNWLYLFIYSLFRSLDECYFTQVPKHYSCGFGSQNIHFPSEAAKQQGADYVKWWILHLQGIRDCRICLCTLVRPQGRYNTSGIYLKLGCCCISDQIWTHLTPPDVKHIYMWSTYKNLWQIWHFLSTLHDMSLMQLHAIRLLVQISYFI